MLSKSNKPESNTQKHLTTRSLCSLEAQSTRRKDSFIGFLRASVVKAVDSAGAL